MPEFFSDEFRNDDSDPAVWVFFIELVNIVEEGVDNGSIGRREYF